MGQSLLALMANELRTSTKSQARHEKTGVPGKESITFGNILKAVSKSGRSFELHGKSADAKTHNKEDSKDHKGIYAFATAGEKAVVLELLHELALQQTPMGKLQQAQKVGSLAEKAGRMAVMLGARAERIGSGIDYLQSVILGNRQAQIKSAASGKASMIVDANGIQTTRELRAKVGSIAMAANAIKREGFQRDVDPAKKLTIDARLKSMQETVRQATGDEVKNAHQYNAVSSANLKAAAAAVKVVSGLAEILSQGASSSELGSFEKLAVKNAQKAAKSPAQIVEAADILKAAKNSRLEMGILRQGSSFETSQTGSSKADPIFRLGTPDKSEGVDTNTASKVDAKENIQAINRAEKGEVVQEKAAAKAQANAQVADENKQAEAGAKKLSQTLMSAAKAAPFSLKEQAASMAAIRTLEVASQTNEAQPPQSNLNLSGITGPQMIKTPQGHSMLSSGIMERLVQHASWIKQNARPAVRLNLVPQFLGAIQINVIVRDDGAQVRIVAERHSVAKALDGNLASLVQRLNDIGMPVEEIIVDQEMLTGEENFAGDWNQPQDGGEDLAEERASLAGVLPEENRGSISESANDKESQRRVSIHDGTLDLRV